MKNLFILFLFIIPMSLIAQEIHVTQTTKLEIGHPAYFPSFGNNKDILLISSPNYKGLTVFNISDNSEIFITDALGAGNQPVMESSGKITYHGIKFHRGRKQRVEMNFKTDFQSVNKVNIENNIQVKVDGKQLKIYRNNQLKSTIQPLGNYYYLWASVSPNQEQLLFTVVGKGTFVSDLQGNSIQEIGYLNAPQWLNNQWVVGMNDKDDGEQILSSTIEAVYVKTLKRTTLTEATEVVALYPRISPTSDRLVFHTPVGEIYTLEFTIND